MPPKASRKSAGPTSPVSQNRRRQFQTESLPSIRLIASDGVRGLTDQQEPPLPPRPAHHEISIPLPAFGTALPAHPTRPPVLSNAEPRRRIHSDASASSE